MDPGPLSNEPPLETHVHIMQVVMLLTSLLYHWRDRQDFFASGNLSVYYPAVSPRSGRTVRRKLAFRGPDFFIVLGARRKPRRNSWVVQNEDGKYPDVIVEVLSKSTRANDRGKKKTIYERIFRTPEYFLFDPITNKLEGYRLVNGRYKAIPPDVHGHLPSERLGLSVGLLDMPDMDGDMARLFTPEGELVPIPQEAAVAVLSESRQHAARAAAAERQAKRAEKEKERAEKEKERAEKEKERLAAKLRELGVDPERLA